MSRYNYRRRDTHPVRVGDCVIGGGHPVVIQTMTNTDTNDAAGSAAQIMRIRKAGAPLVRLTTQGVREASALGEIRRILDREGCSVALSADVHFNPAAALKAAETADKVRINPGNFADVPRTFAQLDFTDEEYAAETEKIRRPLQEFISVCRSNGTAVRLGVNHGSLSDRIMSRYGNTPLGMTESVMEYLRVFRDEDFRDVVVSVKSSSPAVMVETVREVAAAMDAEGMPCPLHIGVTEAGDGEDGRIKSAVGIGTLLAEGLGDTIRVSLSEPPENEVPVARLLADYISSRESHPHIEEPVVAPERFHAPAWGRVLAAHEIGMDGFAVTDASAAEFPADGSPVVITSSHVNAPGEIAAAIDRARSEGKGNPVVMRLRYDDADKSEAIVKASADYGFLLLNGYADGIAPEIPSMTEDESRDFSLSLLQACGLRRVKTEYIACPGCGRTLFDLPATLQEVKRATSHLSHLKIGVMGCIVNGPGEMAGADYGFVGAGPGRVSLYKGKDLIVKNIPSEEAIERFIALIKENGDWIEPEV